MQEIESKKQKEVHHINATKKIAFSFLGVIFVGSMLLSLDISNQLTVLPYLDNLFIATSATCVTGLVTTVVTDQYSVFGQIVILIMIQIGGLGFLTFLSLTMLKMRKRLSLQSRIVLQEALNQPGMNEIENLVKKVVKYTFLVESIGMIGLCTVFVPEYGFVKGLYYALFHSISAFCNAGFDLLGSNSLVGYQTNIIVNITITSLIILGGLGFVVWFDVLKTYKKEQKRSAGFHLSHLWKKLAVHTKLVLIITIVLIASGTLLFLGCEFGNDASIGSLSLLEKLQVSYFQSVTLRTAGFATVDIAQLYNHTKLWMCLFMFIGGSPAGTAGGIKTVTFAIVCLMIYNIYHGRKEVTLFQRRIKKRLIIRAFAICTIGLLFAYLGLFVLTMTEPNLHVVDLIFEAFSAFATVGLSAGVTPLLSSAGKVVIIVLMYIGRIGPVTLLLTFAKKENMRQGKVEIRYLDEDVLLG